jgi:hypothetical protein
MDKMMGEEGKGSLKRDIQVGIGHRFSVRGEGREENAFFFYPLWTIAVEHRHLI